MTRALRRLAALAAAVALAFALGAGIAACDPSGSPNCPPGQWRVDEPGYGWQCAPGSGQIFTPTASFGGAR